MYIALLFRLSEFGKPVAYRLHQRLPRLLGNHYLLICILAFRSFESDYLGHNPTSSYMLRSMKRS